MVASSPNACLFIVTGVYKTRGEASGKGVLSVLWNGAWMYAAVTRRQAETVLTQFTLTRGENVQPKAIGHHRSCCHKSFPPFH